MNAPYGFAPRPIMQTCNPKSQRTCSSRGIIRELGFKAAQQGANSYNT